MTRGASQGRRSARWALPALLVLSLSSACTTGAGTPARGSDTHEPIRHGATASTTAPDQPRAARSDGPSSAQASSVLRGVVGIEAEIGPEARTARILGTRRSGSGVVIDANGLVATVGYLILEARSATIVVDGQRRVPATIIGYDHDSGLGLLRARGALDVQPLALGESTDLERGSRALVVSHGGTRTAQPAVVVSRRPYAGYWEYLLEDALFVAPTHPLYAGAALLDPQGRLLGIGALAVGDAIPGPRPLPGNVFIPLDLLEQVLGDLLVAGRSQAPARPWLGLYAEDTQGPVIVRRIVEGGPAAGAGLVPGDVVVGVGDQPITSLADFYRAIWQGGVAGDTVGLTVLRGEALEPVVVESMDRYDWLRIPVREDP